VEDSITMSQTAVGPKAIRSNRVDWRRLGYQLTGVSIALLLWQFLTSSLFLNEQFSRSFSPANTFGELFHFISGGAFIRHAVPSLSRVAVGLAIAVAIGIPVGILIGYFSKLNLLTNTVFQFIRMTSPLAWMPIAIIIFGVGNKPVYFLIVMAAVWPIIINTAHGVRNVNPIWVKVVRMLGGAHRAVLRRAVVPAIVPDMLTGLRISLGISWIILVPAEMLGVPSGLGYYILDTRDRFNYGELAAVILVIGLFGFISDTLVRLLQQRFSWRKDTDQGLVL
jgi:NitT/TauT family transport system permease protein